MQHLNDDIRLRDVILTSSKYWKLLVSKRYKILIITFIFFLLMFAFRLSTPVKYDAKLTFVVDHDQGSSGVVSSLAGTFGIDLGGVSSTFSQQNIMELIKSREVVGKALIKRAVIDGKDDYLIEHFLEINKYRENWANEKDLKALSFNDNIYTVKHDSIMNITWKSVVQDLKIDEESDEANIITLSYVSVNEKFAKIFVEELISQMSIMYVKYQTGKARNTLDYIQFRADSVFSELQIVEEEYARVQDINRRITRASGRLRELQLLRDVQVLNTMYLEIVKNLEISKVTLLNQTPIIQIVDGPVLPLDRSEYSSYIYILFSLIGLILSSFYFILSKILKDILEEV